MRAASALLVGFLTLGVTGFQLSPSTPGDPKKKPELAATIHKLGLSGVSRGPLLSSRPAKEARPVTQLAKDLLAYYQDQRKEPPWKDAVRHLSAAEPAQRSEAASYLRDLLDQALKDELTGVGPLQASPAWGVGATSQARGLREGVAAALVEASPTPAVLPVVRWFLEHEKLTRLQGQVLKVVTGLQAPEAAALFLELATKPHPNAEVALTALTQVGERKIKVTVEQLAPLCQHHRSQLRGAAIALNTQLGFPPPPKFDAVRAVQSAPLRKLMDEISRLVIEPVPASAPFVWLTITHAGHNPFIVRGWLLSEDGEQWELFTPHSRRSSFPKKAPPNGTMDFTQVAIEDEIHRVMALRRTGDKDFELSYRGGLSGQFQGHAAGEYEALLAQWLYAGKRFEAAAAVLLPALDTLLLDSHLVDITRDRLGDWYGQQMFAAFAGDRNYERTELLAKRLAEHFAGTRFHAYAVRLLDELPRRRDDFKTFRLPTPREWAEQKERMSRHEQIDFLCSRFRLLNCFQMGQPGGPMYDETQYAEPCGISPDAAWGRNQGKTEVINPLVELIGPLYGRQKAAQSDGIGLTVAEIPALAVHLREDWFFPTVSFWRDFSSDRNLHRTRPFVASLINRIAWRLLCDTEKLEAMSDEQREVEITRLTNWAKENRAKDETALLLGALEDTVKSGTPWIRMNQQTIRLVELKAKAAIPLLFRCVEEGLSSGFARDIRIWCDRIDPGALDELAKKGLKNEDEKVRMRVALLALLTADRAEALAVLGDGLENRTVLLSETVSGLLNDRAEDSRTTAARVFKNRHLPTIDGRARSTIVRSTLSAGIDDGLRLYLRLLETTSNTIEGKTNDRPVAEMATEELLAGSVELDREVMEIKRKAAPPEEKIAALKTWLKGKIEKMERRK